MSAGEVVPAAGLRLAAAEAPTEEPNTSDLLGFWVFLMSDAVIFACCSPLAA
jgi:heme/copper-type cytochrome/quinol oxidase subunit 3